MLLNEDFLGIEKLNVKSSVTFVVDEISGLLLNPSTFSITHLRPT